MTTASKARTALFFFAALLLSAGAHAQLFRAYVAPTGSDANPCNLPQPCRLLPAALAAVASGGEIWMLDSANYNTATVTIDKSVSILAVPGAIGSIVAIGGPAISITAAGLTISLRNVVIVPFVGGGGTNGIEMPGASTLIIEDSLITSAIPCTGAGVMVDGTGSVRISNTTFRNILCTYAVDLRNGATGSISTSSFLNVFGGVTVASTSIGATTKVSVSDSTLSAAGASSTGIKVTTTASSAAASTFVTRCAITGFDTGLRAATGGSGTAAITVSGTMVSGSTNAWYQAGTGSVIQTLGNNHIVDNVTSVGSLTPVALQ